MERRKSSIPNSVVISSNVRLPLPPVFPLLTQSHCVYRGDLSKETSRNSPLKIRQEEDKVVNLHQHATAFLSSIV